MKKTIIYLLAQISFIAIGQAQYSSFDTTYHVYKITTDEARNLISNKENLNEKYFHSLIDTFLDVRTGIDAQTFPSGHYLSAIAIGEDVNINLVSVNTISAVVQPNKRDLLIQVYDSLGNHIPNAEVKITDKTIEFNTKKGGYFKSKWKKEGFVEISAQGETLFYKLKTVDHNWKLVRERYRYFARGKLGRIVTYPVRLGRSIYHYGRRAIKWQDFKIYSLRNFAHRRRNKRQYKGYTALQQPIYQPGDTVKVKAYITKHNGKKIKDELHLALYANRGKTYFNIPVKPDKNGNYIYEFVVGDSLTLDQNYTLKFYNKKKHKKNTFQQQFYYEDYQLDEVSWTFEVKEEFNYEDPVLFFAEGKDANGKTIPDGKVKITVLRGQLYEHYQEQLYIPDTIWQEEINLRARGKTQIVVPDSLLPYADIQLNAKVELLNFNGEIHKQTETFKISRKPERIEIKIQNGYLFADFYKNGKKVDTIGSLKYWLENEVNLYTSKNIQFPFKEKINPYIMRYNFNVDRAFESTRLTESDKETSAKVNLLAQWINGKAEFKLNNPNNVPVHYTIRTKNKVIQQDSTKTSETIFAKSKHNGKYFIDYSFVWGGRVYEKSQGLQAFKKQLNIDIKQANEVRPGELVQTQVEVLDYKGKPVKNVNITAGAYNSQFKKTNNFTAPQISYKNKRDPFRYTNFKLEDPNVGAISLSMSEFFYEQMNLEDHFFYRVRYENPDGIILQYDTLYQNKYKDLCQVAPYLIRNGKEVPAEMIYLNAKLVYYAGTTVKQPYSFTGYHGKNTLTIRTYHKEYKFHDIELKKGHKLEMIVDVNSILNSEYKDKVRIRNVGIGLTVQEKRLLNNSILQLKGNHGVSYLWQDNTNVIKAPATYRHSIQLLGPLDAGQRTGFVAKDRFIRSFVFTPGFSVEISRQQERLYANTLFDIKNKWNLSHRRVIHNFGEKVHTRADIISQSPRQKKIFFGTPNFLQIVNKGHYQFILPQNSQYIALVLTDSIENVRRVLRPGVRKMVNLKAGNYHLHVFTNDNQTFKHAFRIKENHLLHEDLAQIEFEKDSSDVKLNRFVHSAQAKTEKKIDDFTAQFLNKKQQGIIGRISLPQTDSLTNNFFIRLFKDDLIVTQTTTDSLGQYEILCYPGAYQLNIANLSNGSSFEFPVFVTDDGSVRLDLIYFQNAYYLNQIEVIGFKTPLIKKDMSRSSLTVSAKEIRNIPTKSIKALQGRVSGVAIDDGDDLNIRGSRNGNISYYIDGVLVEGNIIPDSASGYSNPTRFTKLISGTITDAVGEPLIGASVVIKGTMIGTITDIDGSYSILAPEGDLFLEISYTGFDSKIIIADSATNNVDVTLEQGIELDEVVVTGYGVAKSNSKLLASLDEPPPLEGGVQLRSDFKDYAYWQPNLITDKNGNASFQTVFPDKLTSWRTFVIGMNKKQQAGVAYANTKSFKPLVSQLALPRFLLAGDESQAIGKSVNYTPHPYPIETRFLLEDEVIQTEQSNVVDAILETAEIKAPTDVDSLAITYDLKTGDYGDGEKRIIPIFPNAIKENTGEFHILEGDTTLTLELDPEKGALQIYAQGDVLNMMLRDLEYLVKYPYGCNEQTASRLIGLLLEKQIRKNLNQSFQHEDKIIKMIVRLKKNQNEDGSWGWWSGNQPINWITIHVLKALSLAQEAGYKTSAFDLGIRYITNFLPTASIEQQLNVLDLLSSIGQAYSYDSHLAKFDTLDLNLKDQFTIIKIKQEQNLEYKLDSLETHRRTNIFGGSYWGNTSTNVISKNVALTLLAYEIYQNDNQTDRLREIRQFLLMRRSDLSRTYGIRFGRNTYETAKILSVLLPDLLTSQKEDKFIANTLTITGRSKDTISYFPYRQTAVGESKLEIKKEGTGTLFFTSYQTFMNPAPEPKRDLIDIHTSLQQNGKILKKLDQGEHVQLVVDVEVYKDFEFAMVEIPIPAACSYFSKPNYRRGVEVHREYFKNKTAIFCRKLPAGTHQFTIDLEVRFAGKYSLLPVKIEQMYFPIFYGRNEIKKVKVN